MRLGALCLAVFTAAAVAQDDRAEKLRRAIVWIEVTDEGMHRALELRRRNAPAAELRRVRIRQKFRLVTTGVTVSPKGEIVTAALHPRAELRVDVTFHDGSRERAQLVGTDPLSNLALVRVNRPTRDHLELKTDAAAADDRIDIAGHSDNRPLLTSGVVARCHLTVAVRDLYGVNQGRPFRVSSVFVVAAENGRPNPGSACVDADGRLAGIVLGAAPRPPLSMQVANRATPDAAFAIPIDRVARIVSSLRKHKRVIRAHFGLHLEPVPHSLRAHFDLPASAAAVFAVVPGSPAAQANLRRHDVILDIGGKTFRDMYHLDQAMADETPNRPVEIRLLREGKPLTVTVTPTER